MPAIRKAVITAAGRGTRQYPATNTVQKELFPLVDVDGYAKPTVQIIVEETLASGVEEVCIVANPTNLPALKAHFRGLSGAERTRFAGKAWGLALSDQLENIQKRLTFVVQETQEGFGHAVYQARDFVGDEPCLVLLGDHVYVAPKTRCARQVAEAYERYNAPVSAVSTSGESVVPRYGILKGAPLPGDERAYKITRMVEKPSVEQARAELTTPGLPGGEYLSFFGIHAFPPAIFDCLKYLIDHDIRQKDEIQFTAAQALLLEQVSLYVGCTVQGARYDMGVPEGLIETQAALALYSPFAQNLLHTVQTIERQKSAPAR